jgi:enamine deaminase RidA (YjgF/YER057c/UK114 family)
MEYSLRSVATTTFVSFNLQHFRFVLPTPSNHHKMVETERHLAEIGIVLPPPPKAAANYAPCQRCGNLLYLSGHLPLKEDGSLMTGRIGPSHNTVEYGYEAARQVGFNLVATMQHELGGDLDRVEQIVKLFGIVQSTDDFHEQHKVINGCSDMMMEIFGPERGLHARSAIGTNALPLDLAVEIEAIVRIKDDAASR